MIYILVFLISLFFIWLSGKISSHKVTSNILIIIGLLVPCIFAGMRDLSIGTDLRVYVYHLFQNTSHFSSAFDFVFNRWSTVSDPLYLLLTFFSAKLSDDIFYLLFFIEVLVIFPLYYAIKEFCGGENANKKSLILGLFLFFMFFYNQSFNIVRQSIAISFSLLSFSKFFNHKYKLAIMYLIIGVMFHYSALVMILVYLIYMFFEKNQFKEKKLLIIKYIICIFSFLFIIFLKDILRFFVYIGFNSVKFEKTLATMVAGEFSIVNTIFYIFIFLIVFLNKKQIKEKIGNYHFYSFISFISIIILQANVVLKFANRIGFFLFYITVFLVLPKILISSDNNKNRKMYLIIVIIIFALYWLFWTVLQNYNETFPFVFR